MDRHIRRLGAKLLLLGFLLGIYRGKVTLWQEGNAHPLQIYDIPARSLPPEDRLQLEKGIRLETTQELWIFLEKFF